MYDVQEAEYGISVDLDGYLDMEEVETFCEEFESYAASLPDGWSVIADHRNLSALPDGADARFAEMMTNAVENGVGPTAVVVDSAIAAMQQRRMQDEVGIEGQKVINVEDTDDWEQTAREWIRQQEVVNG